MVLAALYALGAGWHLVTHRNKPLKILLPTLYFLILLVGALGAAGAIFGTDRYGGQVGEGIARLGVDQLGPFVAALVLLLVTAVGAFLTIEYLFGIDWIRQQLGMAPREDAEDEDELPASDLDGECHHY